MNPSPAQTGHSRGSRARRPARDWLSTLLLAVTCTACAGARPAGLGPASGRLAPCPDSPNCVSSFESDDEHGIAPLEFSGDASAAWARLRTVLQRQDRVRIVAETERYLHAEFASLVFRFVDDVEFLLDVEARAIHCRSASRVGHSDLGANRKRIEKLRAAFEKATP